MHLYCMLLTAYCDDVSLAMIRSNAKTLEQVVHQITFCGEYIIK